MRKIELEELKQLQLQILDEVASFCNQHNIKYFLMAGTLLGAVRHQGYIPWDDDIDIGMLREDYEKFIKLFPQFDKNYYLYGYEVNHKSSFPFLKICLKNTIMKENSIYNEEYGINIDLFPIDGISSHNTGLVFKKIQSLICLRHLKVYGMNNNKSLGVKKILKKIVLYFIQILSISYILDILILELKKQGRFKSIVKGNLVWGYGKKELVSPDIFDEMIEISFEGKMYTIPEKYDIWLSCVFGDYMTLPPIEERKTHHNFNAYSYI